MKTPTCPYCGAPAVLVESREIYGPGRDLGKHWLCRPCWAYVGTHSNSPRHAPLGPLADRELRLARQRAHLAFDWIWKRLLEEGEPTQFRARRKAYTWLANQLGIEVKVCHIAWLDLEQCQKAISLCNTVRGHIND